MCLPVLTGGKRKRGGPENIAPDPFPKLAVLYGAQHACMVGGVGGRGYPCFMFEGMTYADATAAFLHFLPPPQKKKALPNFSTLQQHLAPLSPSSYISSSSSSIPERGDRIF